MVRQTDITSRVLKYLTREPNRDVTPREVADFYGLGLKQVGNVLVRLASASDSSVSRTGRGTYRMAMTAGDDMYSTTLDAPQDTEAPPPGEQSPNGAKATYREIHRTDDGKVIAVDDHDAVYLLVVNKL